MIQQHSRLLAYFLSIYAYLLFRAIEILVFPIFLFSISIIAHLLPFPWNQLALCRPLVRSLNGSCRVTHHFNIHASFLCSVNPFPDHKFCATEFIVRMPLQTYTIHTYSITGRSMPKTAGKVERKNRGKFE